uniref:PRA1 family protein n=1 Tax=Strombidinopsis acuminata TaxID=141414 RepID=A0A7S3U4T7_9SPIT
MAATSGMAKNVEQFLKRVRKWDVEFLCLGQTKESFNMPRPEDAMARMTANLEYFAANYAFCLALFALIAVVIYPQLLVLVCCFSGLWYALLTRPPHIKVQVAAILVTKSHMKYALAGVNGLVVLIFARTMIFATIGASLLFVLAHAALHEVPSKAKGKMEEKEAEREP